MHSACIRNKSSTKQQTQKSKRIKVRVNRYKYSTMMHDARSYRYISLDMCIDVVLLLLLLPVYLSA
jgi:hypothetical protein